MTNENVREKLLSCMEEMEIKNVTAQQAFAKFFDECDGETLKITIHPRNKKQRIIELLKEEKDVKTIARVVGCTTPNIYRIKKQIKNNT